MQSFIPLFIHSFIHLIQTLNFRTKANALSQIERSLVANQDAFEDLSLNFVNDIQANLLRPEVTELLSKFSVSLREIRTPPLQQTQASSCWVLYLSTFVSHWRFSFSELQLRFCHI